MAAPRVLTQQQVADGLGVTRQAVQTMVTQGHLIPSGPKNKLTERDALALAVAHTLRESLDFRVDQLRPWMRAIQRGPDWEVLRRTLVIEYRLHGEPKWGIEVVRDVIGNDTEPFDDGARAQISAAAGVRPDQVGIVFQIALLVRETLRKGRKLTVGEALQKIRPRRGGTRPRH
jgi:hypothetical protein